MAHVTHIYLRTTPTTALQDWQSVIALLQPLIDKSSSGFYTAIAEGMEWILIDLADSYPFQALLPIMVQHHAGEVVGFTYHTVVDGFEYLHYDRHQLRRHLDYGMEGEERTWNVVEGEAGEWEAEEFFTPENLESDLSYLEEPADAALIADIRAVYASRTLKLGVTYPFVDYLSVPWGLDLPGAKTEFVAAKERTLLPAPKKNFWSRLFGG